MSVDFGKVVVFVTASTEEEAEKIAGLLLERRKAITWERWLMLDLGR